MSIVLMSRLPIATFPFVPEKRERYEAVLMEGQKSLFQQSNIVVIYNHIILWSTMIQ